MTISLGIAHNNLRDQIAAAIREAIERCGNAAELSPTTLAVNVHRLFDPNEIVELHIAYASIEHIKQIAREVLRNSFDGLPADEQKESVESANPTYQNDMFSGLLQERYPVLLNRKKGDDPIYKLRRFMSIDEVAACIAQLRKSAVARMQHADALEAWNDARRENRNAA